MNIPREILNRAIIEKYTLENIIYSKPNMKRDQLLFIFLRYHKLAKLLDEYNYQQFLDTYINFDN